MNVVQCTRFRVKLVHRRVKVMNIQGARNYRLKLSNARQPTPRKQHEGLKAADITPQLRAGHPWPGRPGSGQLQRLIRARGAMPVCILGTVDLL